MLTIFTEIDNDDGVMDGNITTSQWCDGFYGKKGMAKNTLKKVDVQYLSLKYRNLDH